MKILSGALGLIGTIVGGWLFLDSYFVHASDFNKNKVSTEQTMIEMRIDILEGRYYRAKDRKDIETMHRLEQQIKRLEQRRQVLDQRR